jgi:hypothetical protein
MKYFLNMNLEDERCGQSNLYYNARNMVMS